MLKSKFAGFNLGRSKKPSSFHRNFHPTAGGGGGARKAAGGPRPSRLFFCSISSWGWGGPRQGKRAGERLIGKIANSQQVKAGETAPLPTKKTWILIPGANLGWVQSGRKSGGDPNKPRKRKKWGGKGGGGGGPWADSPQAKWEKKTTFYYPRDAVKDGAWERSQTKGGREKKLGWSSKKRGRPAQRSYQRRKGRPKKE